MDLTLEDEVVVPRALLRVGGDVDIDTTPALRLRVRELIDRGVRQLVVDISGIDFIDSTGLGVLVASLKETQSAGGTLELVCTQPKMRQLLRLTGLDSLFTIHDNGTAAAAGAPGAG